MSLNSFNDNYKTNNCIITNELMNNIDVKKNEKLNDNGNNSVKTKMGMQERVYVNQIENGIEDLVLEMMDTSLLSMTFFCPENIQMIQNGIRAGLYKMSDKKYMYPINCTSVNLQLIMKSILHRYGNYETETNDIKNQIVFLNSKVLDYCIPFIYKAAVSYEKYLFDQTHLALPLEHAVQVDRDFKQLKYRLL